MNQIQRAAAALSSLSVFRGVLDQAVPRAFYRLLWAPQGSEREFFEAWGAFSASLCEQNGCDSLSRCLTEPVLDDDNAFSRMAASGTAEFPPALLEAASRDLEILLDAAALSPEDVLSGSGFAGRAEGLRLPGWKAGEPVPPLRGKGEGRARRLAEYYRKNGCGLFARRRAFFWRDGTLRPVAHPDPVRLADLSGYEIQRRMAVENTAAFLRGLPANNCLLYGDRGTGKSSTVKALLNEYYPQGLRMIQMPKEALSGFPALAGRLAGLPLKFIIFIDDLTFTHDDASYAPLKAVLEGGLASRPENTLVYATSNRRHLVRETFSDREGDEIHRNDTIQENLSLADRFGLSICFSLPDKKEYLAIVRSLAQRRGLRIEPEQLEAGAERWAIARGGRSPRCAVQYIRALEAQIRPRDPA
jgi:hypothetical protein